MGVVMRDGIEYEFTVSFMLDYNHVASSTKDRTGMFDGKYFTIDANTGKRMYEWLSSGAPAADSSPSVPAPTPAPSAESPEQLQKAIDAVDALIKPLVTAENKAEITAKIKSIIGVANYKKCSLTFPDGTVKHYLSMAHAARDIGRCRTYIVNKMNMGKKIYTIDGEEVKFSDDHSGHEGETESNHKDPG